MGIQEHIAKTASKAADKIAEYSALSPDQLRDVQDKREKYLTEMPDPKDPAAGELTSRLLASNAVDIFNAYLPQLRSLYVPAESSAEYKRPFDVYHNIRYVNITKWVTDKRENSLEKLVNVYEVLSNEECNIALVFHRTRESVQVFLAVSNTQNASDNQDVESLAGRLADALKGNFPGSEWASGQGVGTVPCLDDDRSYSVACATNIPAEKSEKFISQTIEKLLDGIIPERKSQEYTIILLATPVQNIEDRKLRLSEFYSGLAPYASWQTSFSLNENNSTSSTALIGVNVGASAGVQNGQNQTLTGTTGTTDSASTSDTSSEGLSQGSSTGTTETEGESASEGMTSSHEEGMNISAGVSASEYESTSVQGDLGPLSATAESGGSISQSLSAGSSTADTVGKTASDTVSQSKAKSVAETLSKSTGRAIQNSLGKAVSTSISKAAGTFASTSFGVNVGANFARSSTITATIGKSESITQFFSNYNIKHALDVLQEQEGRLEQGAALGLWDFAAYVLSEDPNTANNVAHSYLALTQGEKSYLSHAAVNLWRGDVSPERESAREICTYLRGLRHPLFALNPAVTEAAPYFNVYPAFVSATTSLTGKELAYALNFPKRSIPGLPVIECAEFGRNVVTYDEQGDGAQLRIGQIYHMHHEEHAPVCLSKESLASHTFVTGSTGSGKSNTVYKMLKEADDKGVGFLVVEPAKGEYKDVFGSDASVKVFGTNPAVTPLLHLNPFSFPAGIHVLEHIDRLIEIFNVCWPMYAAMPSVLKSAVERSYLDCGWDLRESTNEYGKGMWPTFSDVARNVRLVINASDYDTENKGAYKGSLLTRLESLTNGINGLIFSNEEISDTDLFDGKAILDLSRVGSSETKSLLMGMVVLKLQEHRMTDGSGLNSGLRHLTVLEEAHNLLRRTSTEQPVEGGNLLGKSVEMIANAIAEMRTYGEGFIVADQAPGLLDMAAIRNTNTKIIMRLPDLTDRELVGRAANLDDDQIAELAKLPRGVAAIYQDEWVQPVLCKVDKVEGPSTRYVYQRPEMAVVDKGYVVRSHIANLLSDGAAIAHDDLLEDIRPKLRGLGIDASMQVSILRLLENPPAEPRMTKLAPIMSALFPEAKSAVREAYGETHKASDWTRGADEALRATVGSQLDGQARRDAIQGVITDYVLNELGRIDELERWSHEGSLR